MRQWGCSTYLAPVKCLRNLYCILVYRVLKHSSGAWCAGEQAILCMRKLNYFVVQCLSMISLIWLFFLLPLLDPDWNCKCIINILYSCLYFLGVVHKVRTQKNWKFCPPPPVAGSTFPDPPLKYVRFCTSPPPGKKRSNLYTQTHCLECHRLF